MRDVVTGLVGALRRAPGTALLTVLTIVTLGLLNPLACLLHCAALHRAQLPQTGRSTDLFCRLTASAHSSHLPHLASHPARGGHHASARGAEQHMAIHAHGSHLPHPAHSGHGDHHASASGVERHLALRRPGGAPRPGAQTLRCMQQSGADLSTPRAFYELLLSPRVAVAAALPLLVYGSSTRARQLQSWAAPPPAPPPRPIV